MRVSLYKFLGDVGLTDKILSCLSERGHLSSSLLMRKFKITIEMARNIIKIVETKDAPRVQDLYNPSLHRHTGEKD